MEYVFGCRARWLRTIAAGVCVVILAALALGRVPRAAAQPNYLLYYSLQIPLTLPGITLSDDGSTHTTYTGTLRGTLGGLPLASAKLLYGPGASKALGGGTFSLATAAGAVRDGQILMSTSETRTTLLFFGVYLGARLEFSLVSDREQFGGSGATATGLARTSFRSHEEYRAAVQKAIASLDPASRDQILAQADTNLRLADEYQQKSR